MAARDWIGFDGPVNTLAWSADGEWLAAAGGGTLLALRVRLARGEPVRALDTGGDVVLKADSVCVHGDKPSAVAQAKAVRDALYAAWSEMGVLGRTYVASEGINAQISLPTDRLEDFRAHVESLGWLPDLRLNVAVEEGKSFFKLVVRVRDKIVADGLVDGTFDVTDCGKHLKAEEFNALTDKEDTILIDMRNAYESEVGHFEGAICPDVNTFREEIAMVEDMFQDAKEQPIVMYCT